MAGKLEVRKPQGLFSWRRDPFGSFRDEMEEMLSRFWDSPRGALTEMTPTADLTETPEALQVRMDLPGIEPKELDIQLTDQVLTVRGERKEEKEEKGKTFHRIERHSGSFSRAFMLPCAVAEEQVAAKYENGVLAITLPKSKDVPKRKIEVKA